MEKLLPSPAAFDLVRHFEGFRAVPYQDLAGYTTYGYGHKTTGITPSIISGPEAEELLKSDLNTCAKVINASIYVKLSQKQFDALCSLVFNIGPGHFLESTLRKRLNMSDYHGAADQFLVWDKVKGEVVHGLVVRRVAEHELFIEGTV